MEKINVAELLKNCPSGMELDCIMYDDVTLKEVDINNDNYPIQIETTKSGFSTRLTKYGQNVNVDEAKCVIFPKGKTTWKGFQRPFKDGDVVATTNGLWIGITTGGTNNECIPTYCVLEGVKFEAYLEKKEKWRFNRLATEEEKQELFDAIKANGYKWNPETKTLEKLIEPKFKVGDKIRYKRGNRAKLNIESININEQFYYTSDKGRVYFKHQDDWELVPNKFDITTLKPFESRVLVRTSNKWVAAFYSHYDKEAHLHHCVVGGLWYKQCIPYNDETKHLLDTINDCDEYYKTWEEL